MKNLIDVEIYFDPQHPDEMGFSLRSQDGSTMTAQDALDAVAEALLLHYDNFTIGPEPHYDA